MVRGVLVNFDKEISVWLDYADTIMIGKNYLDRVKK